MIKKAKKRISIQGHYNIILKITKITNHYIVLNNKIKQNLTLKVPRNDSSSCSPEFYTLCDVT